MRRERLDPRRRPATAAIRTAISEARIKLPLRIFDSRTAQLTDDKGGRGGRGDRGDRGDRGVAEQLRTNHEFSPLYLQRVRQVAAARSALTSTPTVTN